MRNGFTLLEVVIALLFLELAVIGAAGMLGLASSTLGRAEALERAASRVEGALDSLNVAPGAGDGSATFAGGEVRWVVREGGDLRIVALRATGDTLVDVESVLMGR